MKKVLNALTALSLLIAGVSLVSTAEAASGYKHTQKRDDKKDHKRGHKRDHKREDGRSRSDDHGHSSKR